MKNELWNVGSFGTQKSGSSVSKVNKAIFFIDFSVPPNPPVIVNEAGREATSQLGPYPEGATTQISCEVRGGKTYLIWHTASFGTIHNILCYSHHGKTGLNEKFAMMKMIFQSSK